jgi:hypothetical protein
MGKSVSETEIKTNFLAGIKKLEAKNISGKNVKAVSVEHLFFASLFFIINIGKIQSVLPFSFGASLTGDIRIQNR